jgi:hypothetical protein
MRTFIHCRAASGTTTLSFSSAARATTPLVATSKIGCWRKRTRGGYGRVCGGVLVGVPPFENSSPPTPRARARVYVCCLLFAVCCLLFAVCCLCAVCAVTCTCLLSYAAPAEEFRLLNMSNCFDVPGMDDSQVGNSRWVRLWVARMPHLFHHWHSLCGCYFAAVLTNAAIAVAHP